MVTWIEACAGAIVIAYFGGIILSGASQTFSDSFLNTTDKNVLRKRTMFYRILSTSWLAAGCIFILFTATNLQDSIEAIWIIAAATAIIAFLIPGPVTVTTDGLLRTNTLRHDTLIPWEVLDHYEVQKGSQSIAALWVSDVYYFCALDGRKIKVNDWTQDCHHLLSIIRQYKTLSERPFDQGRHPPSQQ